MFGRTYYHEILRKTIVSFGTLFNDIHIVRTNSAGEQIQSLKVPLAYGPKQKFLARLREDATIDKKVAITLPRIGFELSGIEYDGERKLNKMTKIRKVKGTETKQISTQYSPVPYNVNFELFIMAKNSDDSVQIVEQILPYFQPEYTVTIKTVPAMDQIRDVPIILTSTAYEDTYDGDFMTRRAIIYTLNFTAKSYMYGPVTSAEPIQKVTVDQFADMKDKTPPRVRQYTAETIKPTVIPDDDNFGFNETLTEWTDGQFPDQDNP